MPRLALSLPLLAGALLIFFLPPSSLGVVSDLTFLQVSDVHFPYAAADSRATIQELPRGPVSLEGVTVPAPRFVMVTGDLNEYGGGGGAWEGYMKLWQETRIPVYHLLGNHDNTWDCGRPRLRRLYGRAFYSFAVGNAKMIAFDTATPQDPRPSIPTEGLLWLKEELARTPAGQWVFFCCHHPLDGEEFASHYDLARLLDLLRTRNVVLLMVGHGHSARGWSIGGLDATMGGCSFGRTRGYSIISLQGATLRVYHQYVGESRRLVKLLEKPLPKASPFLQVSGLSPGDGKVFGPAAPLYWRLRLASGSVATSGRWVCGRAKGDLARQGEVWIARLPRKGLAPGAHTVHFELTDARGLVTPRTLSFWVDDGPVRIAWKKALGGSCQSGPALVGGRLLVGSNDGRLSAFDAVTGRRRWSVQTGGEVRGRPCVDPASGWTYFASADGALRAVTEAGREKWRLQTGSAIYASPVLAQNLVVCGTNSGQVVAADRRTGKLRWRATAPGYCIPTPAAVGEGAAFLGSWDRYVYALNLADGSLRWRVPSRGSDRPGDVARYYSPATCGPVVCGGNVVVVDRAYFLTVLDAHTGRRLLAEDQCGAVSASADGRFFYLRHPDGRVTKRNADGSVVWTAHVPTGHIPTPPVAAGGRVWMLSTLGTLSVMDDASGKVLWQYKAFSDLYAFAAPAVDDRRVYLADMAGNLLALSLPS